MHVESRFDINCHCDSIIDFLANSYLIVQIYHAKSFKKLFIKVVIKKLKSVVRFNVHKTLCLKKSIKLI